MLQTAPAAAAYRYNAPSLELFDGCVSLQAMDDSSIFHTSEIGNASSWNIDLC